MNDLEEASKMLGIESPPTLDEVLEDLDRIDDDLILTNHKTELLGDKYLKEMGPDDPFVMAIRAVRDLKYWIHQIDSEH